MARTDDDLSLVFVVDHSAQRIGTLHGAAIEETDEAVSVTFLAELIPDSGPRFVSPSLIAHHMVDLARPLGTRMVTGPARRESR
ncbi:hypothetical protein FPZ12_008620 [Amycolatopsis acidicola]|uniref:Uncharacterized protein n=1 Tax=Amycolatopsis acidicola TaxID=2596893 RepID=A0A5N0VC15_9PSEU|nr:hypothetical protein [Amycolatopsis acidicola]KAA9163565.1 hypothetical protein FPZ12_008620 [Amycolatopsis acidicola]